MSITCIKHNVEMLNEAELSHLLHVARPNGGSILDIESYTGQIACALAPLVDSVIALNSYPEKLLLAQDAAKDQNLYNIQFKLGSTEVLTFASCTFDGVVSRNITHALLDVQSFLSETFRVLRPGGWFLIEEAINVGRLGADKDLDRIERIRDSLHIRYYPLEGWLRILNSNGFNVEYQEVIIKPYNACAWLASKDIPKENQEEYISEIVNAKGWLKEYFRAHGDGETFTFHLRRMLMLVRKPS